MIADSPAAIQERFTPGLRTANLARECDETLLTTHDIANTLNVNLGGGHLLNLISLAGSRP